MHFWLTFLLGFCYFARLPYAVRLSSFAADGPKLNLYLDKKWVSHPWRNGLRCIGFILDVSVEYVVLETSAPGARLGDPCHGNDASELRAHLTRVLSNPNRSNPNLPRCTPSLCGKSATHTHTHADFPGNSPT